MLSVRVTLKDDKQRDLRTQPPALSPCPCIDEFNRRRPCDVARCIAQTDRPFCGDEHRRNKAEQQGLVAPARKGPPERHRLPYTAAEAQMALELHERGLIWREVAEILGRTKPSVDKLVQWYRETTQEAGR